MLRVGRAETNDAAEGGRRGEDKDRGSERKCDLPPGRGVAGSRRDVTVDADKLKLLTYWHINKVQPDSKRSKNEIIVNQTVC